MISNNPTCSECQGNKYPITRNYFGQQFCIKCYPYKFKKQACDNCGNIKRIPTFTTKKLCIRCERTGNCVRCKEKIVSGSGKLGKITEYGLVCNKCFHYFTPEEKCELCGEKSKFLSKRKSISEDLRVCPKCSRLNHESCSRCSKFRPVETYESEKPICKRCHIDGNIPCTVCKKPMPAGLGKKCKDCYYKELYQYKIELHLGCIHSQQIKALYLDFADWFLEYKNSFNAAMLISDKSSFFIKISQLWSVFPDYKELVQKLGMREINKNRLIVSWLISHKGMMVDDKFKENQTEYSYIQQQFKKIPDNGIWQKIMDDYYVHLVSKEIKPRSIRLALTPAIALLRQINENGQGNDLPTQRDLESYLNNSLGQRASITGFINFLNIKHNLDLTTKFDKSNADKIRRSKLETKIIELSKLKEFDEKQAHQWVYSCLQYFHNISVKDSYQYDKKSLKILNDEIIIIKVLSNEYKIPCYTSVI